MKPHTFANLACNLRYFHGYDADFGSRFSFSRANKPAVAK